MYKTEEELTYEEHKNKFYKNGDVISAEEYDSKFNPATTRDMSSKYDRPCKGITIDVYDVLLAFKVTNPALQHLIKKALCTGIRGHKNKEQDLQDIIDSAYKAKKLEM